MYLIDKQARPGRPTVKHITKKIYSQLFPDRRLAYRKNYTFKYQKPIPIEDEIAIYLLENTQTLVAVDPETYEELDIIDRFDMMPWPQIQNFGNRLGIPGAHTLKKPVLLKKIRTALAQGQKPITKKQQEQKRQEKLHKYHKKFKNKTDLAPHTKTITPVNGDYYSSLNTVKSIRTRKAKQGEIEYDNWIPHKIEENQWLLKKVK